MSNAIESYRFVVEEQPIIPVQPEPVLKGRHNVFNAVGVVASAVGATLVLQGVRYQSATIHTVFETVICANAGAFITEILSCQLQENKSWLQVCVTLSSGFGVMYLAPHSISVPFAIGALSQLVLGTATQDLSHRLITR